MVLASLLPTLLVAFPFGYQVYHTTRAAAQKELSLVADQAVNHLNNELLFVADRFGDMGQNKEMGLAASNPFFSYRAAEIARSFMEKSPLVDAVLLLDAQNELVEAVPEGAENLQLAPILRSLQQHMPEPRQYQNRRLWFDLSQDAARPMLQKLHPQRPGLENGRLIILAMPLYREHYTQGKSDELQGVLLAIIPFDRLQTLARAELGSGQQLFLATDQNRGATSLRNHQIATQKITIPSASESSLRYEVQVAEPNQVRFAQVQRLAWLLALLVLSLALIFGGAAYWIGLRFLRPLQSLQALVQQYAQGQYHSRVAEVEFVEFQSVAQTLTAMGLQIEQQVETLQAANLQLQQADKLKDDFLANTSHELRTPLHGIIGIATAVLDGSTGPLSPKLHHNLRLIEQSGRRLEAMVNDILDVAKIKNQAMNLNLKALDLFSLVDVVLHLHAAQAEQAGLMLVNSVPHGLAPVLADEARLQQILHNLIGNALKFTPEGGICVSAHEDQDRIWIEVQDTGIGIPADKIDQIFEPFVQVEGGNNQRQGSGLGLAITRDLVRLHGGQLQVHSDANHGSTFSFSLPRAEGEAQTVQQIAPMLRTSNQPVVVTPNLIAKPKLNVQGQDTHVLLVDDESINLDILEQYFFDTPYILHRAQHGVEALQLLEKLPRVDLILLDVMMPNMSGYEVCSALRSQSRYAEVPVLFLTARSQDKDIQYGFSVGGNDYLIKPLSRLELLTRCQYHLNYARVRHELAQLNSHLEQVVTLRTQELEQSLAVIQRHSAVFRSLLETSLDLQNREHLADMLQATFAHLHGLEPSLGMAVWLEPSSNPNNHPRQEQPHYCLHLPPALAQSLTQTPRPSVESLLAQHPSLRHLKLLGWGQELLGHLFLYAPKHEALEEILQLYGRQLASAIQTRQLTLELQEQAVTDSLTHVQNRHFFEKLFANQVRLIQRHPERSFSLISIDLNGLKRVNDTYGHEVGDAYIQHAVRLIQQSLRESDVICRVGGDEFVVLAEHSNSTMQPLWLERLSKKQAQAHLEVLAEWSPEHAGTLIPIRFSVGCASSDEFPAAELRREADHRMYLQKQAFYHQEIA